MMLTIKQSHFKNICLALAIFFSSSESLPTYRFALSVFLLVVYAFFQPKIKCTNLQIKKAMLIFFCILIAALLGWAEVFTYKRNLEYGFVDAVIGLSFKALIVLAIIIMAEEKDNLHKIIGYALFLHLTIFVTQTIVVYGTGYYIDFLSFFSSETSRYGSGFSLPIIGKIYRPTGVYVEPSTYASFILSYVAIRVYLARKSEPLDVVALFSCVLTFSVAAIAYGFVAIVILYLYSNVNLLKKYILAILTLLSIPFLYVFFENIILTRILYTGGSAVSLRENLLNIIFQKQTSMEILFGNGLLGYPTVIVDIMKSGSLWSGNLSALNDNGIWLFIIIKFGIIGLLLVSIFMYVRSRDSLVFTLFLAVLLTKLSLLNFTFIFLMAVLFLHKFNVNRT